MFLTVIAVFSDQKKYHKMAIEFKNKILFENIILREMFLNSVIYKRHKFSTNLKFWIYHFFFINWNEIRKWRLNLKKIQNYEPR